MNGLSSGLAGGEMLDGIGTFANIALTQSDSTAAGFKTDTDMGTVTLGFDKAVEDKLILGLAVSYSRSSADSFFEIGAQRFKSNNKSNSISIAPYAALILNEAKFSFQVQHRYASELRWEFTMVSSTLMSVTSFIVSGRTVEAFERSAA